MNRVAVIGINYDQKTHAYHAVRITTRDGHQLYASGDVVLDFNTARATVPFDTELCFSSSVDSFLMDCNEYDIDQDGVMYRVSDFPITEITNTLSTPEVTVLSQIAGGDNLIFTRGYDGYFFYSKELVARSVIESLMSEQKRLVIPMSNGGNTSLVHLTRRGNIVVSSLNKS